MMGRTAGTFLRISGPHRIVVTFAVAFSYSVSLSGEAAFAASGRLGSLLVPVVGALLVVALGAIRLGRVVVGAGASVVLLTVLVLSGSWMAVALAIVAIAAEFSYFVVPVAVVRRCAVDILFTGVEGAVVPAIGFVLVSGGWKVPSGLLAVTLLVSFALAVAASLREDSRGASNMVDLPGVLTPMGASLLALLAGSAAIALTLGGGGLRLHPELGLLASSVAIMFVFFGWISLVERRPEWRTQRVATLVSSSAIALSVGLVIVTLFA